MNLEGSIDIVITTAGKGVSRVGIRSERPVHACRILQGKTVEEALQMLPLIFSLCGTAQRCAGVRACEQALDIREDPSTAWRRDRLVGIETLREHAWRVLLDWPLWMGEEPHRHAMVRLVKYHDMLDAALQPKESFRPGACMQSDEDGVEEGAAELEGVLEETVFGMRLPDWLALRDEEDLGVWSRENTTVAARLIAEMMVHGWAEAGRCDVEALPPLESAPLGEEMMKDAFVERPRWNESCRETSALTRARSPLLDRLRSQYGNGLLVRLVARLTELAGWGTARDMTMADTPMGDTEAPIPSAPNSGLGHAEAARGRLVHQVVLEEGEVARYRILAPTEWNFHSNGVVAQALAALRGDGDTIRRQAELLIHAIDPCVNYSLDVC